MLDEEHSHPSKENLQSRKQNRRGLSYILYEINPSKIDKCKSKNGVPVSVEFTLLIETLKDKFD